MALPRIFIATPTPGTVKTPFMKCLIATMLDLGSRGIECEVATEEGSSIELQRDLLASRFLDGQCTHIFFVDTDMIWPADLCYRMISIRRPLIGTIAPKRQSDSQRIAKAMERGLAFNEASLFGCDWIYHPLDETAPVTVDNGIMRVAAVGFGIVLIERSVFETMRDRGIIKEQVSQDRGRFYNFFLPHIDFMKRGQHIPEDQSFCRRWRRECGGEIWAYVDSPIFHIGDFGFGGSYMDYLRAVKSLTERET